MLLQQGAAAVISIVPLKCVDITGSCEQSAARGVSSPRLTLLVQPRLKAHIVGRSLNNTSVWELPSFVVVKLDALAARGLYRH
jgi:hypothetical protein